MSEQPTNTEIARQLLDALQRVNDISLIFDVRGEDISPEQLKIVDMCFALASLFKHRVDEMGAGIAEGAGLRPRTAAQLKNMAETLGVRKAEFNELKRDLGANGAGRAPHPGYRSPVRTRLRDITRSTADVQDRFDAFQAYVANARVLREGKPDATAKMTEIHDSLDLLCEPSFTRSDLQSIMHSAGPLTLAQAKMLVVMIKYCIHLSNCMLYSSIQYRRTNELLTAMMQSGADIRGGVSEIDREVQRRTRNSPNAPVGQLPHLQSLMIHTVTQWNIYRESYNGYASALLACHQTARLESKPLMVSAARSTGH